MVNEQGNNIGEEYKNTNKDNLECKYQSLDYELNSRIWNTEFLKNAAIKMDLCRPRTLAWAILLKCLPWPSDPCIRRLRKYRAEYEELRSRFSRDPRLEIGDDPLSQSDESVWNQHFCDNELRALILQDVIRTFPDEQFFREQHVQDLMVCVLFVWARVNSHTGYRQGMHEVLAPLLYELHLDRRYAPPILSDILEEVLNKEYIEHDSYMLFVAVMRGLELFYQTGNSVPSSTGRIPHSTQQHNPNAAVKYLDRIKIEHLTPLDLPLCSHLNSCNISLELFGIRWLRLLFGREFPRDEISDLWGFLFAHGPSLPLLDHVVVAMLVSMRNTLLDADPAVVLSALMRPSGLHAEHIAAMALHLYQPLTFPRPPTPTSLKPPSSRESLSSPSPNGTYSSEEVRGASGTGAYDGIAEGADVARELATLAVVRARLPAAAAALGRALPRHAPHNVAEPLAQILQLSALLQCRHHDLVDVETALEAAEGQTPPANHIARRQIVPVNITPTGDMTSVRNTLPKRNQKSNVTTSKELPLKVFKQTLCVGNSAGVPSLDPLKLRTD